MTIQAIPDIQRALASIRAEYARLERQRDQYLAILCAVADGKTTPEELHAFRQHQQVGLRFTDEPHATDSE